MAVPSFLSLDRAVSVYKAEFLADGDTLVVRLFNPGGGNVVALDAVSGDGRIKLYPLLSSSGPRGWSEFSCRIDSLSVEGEWTSKVVWVDPDGAESTVRVVRIR